MISETEEGSILLKLIFEKSHNKGSSEVNTQTKDFLILKPMLFLFVFHTISWSFLLAEEYISWL